MGNHIHLVIETPQPKLVAGMKWLLGAYTSRYNRQHKEFGHLFSGRYKALTVEGSGNGYLKWSEADLKARREREPRKVELAWEF